MAMITANMIQMWEAIKEAKKILTEETVMRTGISDFKFPDFFTKDMQMGQISSYEALQRAMQQQNQIQQNYYQDLTQQGISSAGVINAGLLGQLYPNKIVAYPDGFQERARRYTAYYAEKFGFTWDFASLCFKHPSGASVTSRLLEDAEGTETTMIQIFKRALTPNMHWLDDRINEIRVRLC